VGVAAVDQPVTSGYLPHSGRQELFHSDAEFVRLVESHMPMDAPVFQLPHAEFPVEHLRERMFNNDHGRPYIHALRTRWSWGAVSGTTSAELNKQLALLPIPEMVHRLIHHGYLGLWIDLYGYQAGQSPETTLTNLLGLGPIRSANGRYLFFNLQSYADRLIAGENGVDIVELRRSHPIELTYERGLYSLGVPAAVVWSSGRHGRIVLVNPLSTSRTVTLTAVIRSGTPSQQTVRITQDDVEEARQITGTQSYSRKITVPQNGVVPIDFHCPCAPFTFKGQSKAFYFGLQDVLINE
jgi:hypothetical protein